MSRKIRLRDARPLGDLGRVSNRFQGPRVRIFVGLSRGSLKKLPARCRSFPESFSAREVDEVFHTLRARQVGFVGATRYKARGIFGDTREDSAVYEVIHGFADDIEPDLSDLIANMTEIAEEIGAKFCQEEVLVLVDDGVTQEAVQVVPDY